MSAPEDAHEEALRLLAASDRSADSLSRALVARGATEADAARVVEALVRVGIVDDRRFAAMRAEALAARGKGDLAITADLEARGLDPETVTATVSRLPGEAGRARVIVSHRGRGPATLRLLRSRGFSEESIEMAVADGADPWLP